MRVHYIPGQCVGAFLWLPTSTLDHPLRSWIICPCPPGALADYAEWTMAHVVSVPGLLQFEGFFKSLMNGIESEHRERERAIGSTAIYLAISCVSSFLPLMKHRITVRVSTHNSSSILHLFVVVFCFFAHKYV